MNGRDCFLNFVENERLKGSRILFCINDRLTSLFLNRKSSFLNAFDVENKKEILQRRKFIQ